MLTITVYSEESCRNCGTGKAIDQAKTAANAVTFLGLLKKVKVADKMKISPQYLGDLLAARRPWNTEIVEKFEAAVTELKK